MPHLLAITPPLIRLMQFPLHVPHPRLVLHTPLAVVAARVRHIQSRIYLL